MSKSPQRMLAVFLGLLVAGNLWSQTSSGLKPIQLRAGETSHVQITLSPRDLSLVNLSGDRMVTPGEYQLSLGGGQPTATSAVVSGKFTIEGEQKLPE